MKCLVCRNKFPTPKWPNVNQKYCSNQCCKKAWKLNHPEYKWTNPEKERQIKRRWNWSEKGKLNRKNWYEKNKERIRQKGITQKTREQINSRGKARDKLTKIIKKRCIININCSGRIETHHKDFNSLNNNLNNLEWRCKLHHTDAHHKHNLQILKAL